MDKTRSLWTELEFMNKASQDKSRKRLFGGIVVNKGGTWRLNDNEKYTYDENLTNWKILEI
jgi:hypothetical protein